MFLLTEQKASSTNQFFPFLLQTAQKVLSTDSSPPCSFREHKQLCLLTNSPTCSLKAPIHFQTRPKIQSVATGNQCRPTSEDMQFHWAASLVPMATDLIVGPSLTVDQGLKMEQIASLIDQIFPLFLTTEQKAPSTGKFFLLLPRTEQKVQTTNQFFPCFF